MGRSPLENDTDTPPFFMGVPQSSKTVTSRLVGQATEVLKPVPNMVKTGRSWGGVDGAPRSRPLKAPSKRGPDSTAGVTTSSRAITRVALSDGKLSGTEPR